MAYERVLQDLKFKEEAKQRAPPSDENHKVIYEIRQETVDSFFHKVFSGAELSLDEICQRAVRELLPYLPIEEVSPNQYRYKKKG